MMLLLRNVGRRIALTAAIVLSFSLSSSTADAQALTSSRAAAAQPSSARSLGIAPVHGITALAAAPPSSEEPWGTVVMAWCEWSAPPAHQTVMLGEWSLQTGRWLHRQVLRRQPLCPPTMPMSWSGARLAIAIGNDAERITELVLLERNLSSTGATFREKHATRFEDASAPSLDADGRTIALATYEEQRPIVGPSGETPPPRHALHVRLFDPQSLRIVSARMFRGDRLLRPWMPEPSGHAIRLLGDRLYVALAEDDPRVVAAGVPSLATERERTFPMRDTERSPSSSAVVLNRMGGDLLVGVSDTQVLSADLATVARDPTPIRQPIAYDTATHRVLATDGVPVTLAGWRVQVIDGHAAKSAPYPLESGERLQILFAHGRRVVIGALDPADPADPDATTVTRAIRVLP